MISGLFKSLWKHIKTAGFWIFWILCVGALWKWFRKDGCLEGETLVFCLRQWQSLIAAMVALLIASITWKYTQKSLNQSVILYFASQRERIGDKFDEDLRALNKFEAEFRTCHWYVEKHIESPENEPIQPYVERLKKLQFPIWPDPEWENFFNTCIDEYKDHYDKAKILRFSRPDDFTEHGIRCHGIFKHLTGQLAEVKKSRREMYKNDTEHLSV